MGRYTRSSAFGDPCGRDAGDDRAMRWKVGMSIMQTRFRGHSDLPWGLDSTVRRQRATNLRYKDWEGAGKEADAWLIQR
jgi:hypothetical protein